MALCTELHSAHRPRLGLGVGTSTCGGARGALAADCARCCARACCDRLRCPLPALRCAADDWRFFNKHVPEKVAELHEQGYQLWIIT